MSGGLHISGNGESSLSRRSVSALDAPEPTGFAQAIELVGARRLLFISGQIPSTRDGFVPARFEDQARLVWNNLLAQLSAAEMTRENLVKVTIFLADRAYVPAHRDAYDAALGAHRVSVSTVIAALLNDSWLLEIEAIAAA